MKKIFTFFFACTIAVIGMAQSWDVVRKKGKCTMDEAYYDMIKEKANAYDSIQAALKKCQQDLREAQQKASHKPAIRTFNDSASYAIGQDLFNNWTRQNLGINCEIAGQSLIDCSNGSNVWNSKVTGPLLQKFQQNFEQREQQRKQDMMASKDANIAAGKKFLSEMANNKAVRTTQSGLEYRIIQKGNGKFPTMKDQVKVHYTGTLIDGKKFDSSVDRGTPITFRLDQVIPGWTEGLQLMDEGSKAILYIPYNLAYGEQAMGDIPPGSTLIFEVELIEINPK